MGGAAGSEPRGGVPAAEPVGAVSPNGGKVVRWFIGIGSGGNLDQ